MSSMDFRLEGTDELMQALALAGERMLDVAEVELYGEAEETMKDSKREVSVDQGVLRNSGFVREPKRSATGVTVEMGYGGAAQAYAVYLHEGTGPAVGRPPFRPPVEPFKGWARRVLGDESAAWAVARAVGQRGLRPRKFLERPLKKRAATMASRLATRIRRAVDRGGA